MKNWLDWINWEPGDVAVERCVLLCSSEVIYQSKVPEARFNFTCHVHKAKRLKRRDEMELVNFFRHAEGRSFGDVMWRPNQESLLL